jgi:hypothetical protein
MKGVSKERKVLPPSSSSLKDNIVPHVMSRRQLRRKRSAGSRSRTGEVGSGLCLSPTESLLHSHAIGPNRRERSKGVGSKGVGSGLRSSARTGLLCRRARIEGLPRSDMSENRRPGAVATGEVGSGLCFSPIGIAGSTAISKYQRRHPTHTPVTDVHSAKGQGRNPHPSRLLNGRAWPRW